MTFGFSPRLVSPALWACSVVLAGGGLWLLTHPSPAHRPPAAPRHTVSAPVAPSRAAPPASRPPVVAPAHTASAIPAPAPESARPGPAHPASPAVPVAGDGPGGDGAIQQFLDASQPADLPHGLERELVDLAGRIWLAETTGQGRSQWPGYFIDPAPPHSPYTGVRIQAGIARKATGGRVQVRLVWSGTNPSGEAAGGRLAVIVLRPSPASPPTATTPWEPVR
ncbi:hypothetical protein [Streptomyces sp. NPDC001205]